MSKDGDRPQPSKVPRGFRPHSRRRYQQLRVVILGSAAEVDDGMSIRWVGPSAERGVDLESVGSDASDEICSFGSSDGTSQSEALNKSLSTDSSDEIRDPSSSDIRSGEQYEDEIQSVASWPFVSPTRRAEGTPEGSRRRLPLVPYDPRAREERRSTSKDRGSVSESSGTQRTATFCGADDLK